MNEIIKSWEINALEWDKVIDEEKIPSRKFTNKAIFIKILSLNADKILDLGCGEGWLTRLLSDKGELVTGLDATQILIDKAKTKGQGDYYKFTFEDIIADKKIPNAPFDLTVFNFSLYSNDEELINLLKNLKNNLNKAGKIVIQTLHPHFLLRKNLPYKSQIIQNSWDGLDGNFTNGHPWYARTFEDWIVVFNKANFRLVNMEEVLNNDNQPISVIFELGLS